VGARVYKAKGPGGGHSERQAPDDLATISGLSLGDVRGILDRHYLNNDVALAESAIRKLEDRSIR
jgi:hypothetical protein